MSQIEIVITNEFLKHGGSQTHVIVVPIEANPGREFVFKVRPEWAGILTERLMIQ